MPSTSTTNTIQTSKKHSESSLKAKSIPKTKKIFKKATISYSPSSSSSSDFILYPDDPVVEKNSPDRRARAQRVRAELVSDGLLPSAKKDDETSSEGLTPLQRATRRRSKAEHLPVIHQSKEDSQRSNMNMPPAPSPPRLGTPDLDEIDEDLWSCCSWGESSVESYIAATKSLQGKIFLSRRNEKNTKLTEIQENSNKR